MLERSADWGRRTRLFIGILVTVFALVLSIYDGIAGGTSVTPGGAIEHHGFVNAMDAFDSVLFVLFPLALTVGLLRRWRALQWVAFGLYLAEALLLGFSEGGPHLTFGIPLVLVALLWEARADRPRQGP
jgi:hypothetical protein